MTDFNKSKILYILFVVVLVFLFLAYLFFVFVNPKTGSYVFKHQPIPTPTNIEAQYSNLNQLIPGKSTLEDIDNVAGIPVTLQKTENKVVLYYNTPVKEVKNKVLVKNGVVYFILENVFGNYRGTYDEYVNSFGQPDFILYENTGLFYPWYVFLQRGVMVQSANNIITKIVYFIPQSENDFFNNIAPELNLSRKNLKEEGNAIFAP
jgi:hypothetical protein